MQIVNIYYELARQHQQIKGFFYGKTYNKGAANEAHPLIWVDDPIYGRSVNQTIQHTVNFDVLGIPLTDTEIQTIQAAAYSTGLEIIEKLKRIKAATGYGVVDFNYITLSDYYDNNAAGVRFTVMLSQANPVDICADNFDPDKRFPDVKNLPDFKLEHPDGCAIFNDKKGLPNFKISKK